MKIESEDNKTMTKEMGEFIISRVNEYVEKKQKSGIKHLCEIYIHTALNTYESRVGYFEEYFEAKRWWYSVVTETIQPKSIYVYLDEEKVFEKEN